MLTWEERRAARVAAVRAQVGANRPAPRVATFTLVQVAEVLGRVQASRRPERSLTERPELPRPPMPPPLHEGMPRGEFLDLLAMED